MVGKHMTLIECPSLFVVVSFSQRLKEKKLDMPLN